MSRRKITQEADEESDASETDSESQDTEREQLTQRMPPNLVERVDEFAQENGISSRNAAINMLVQQGLQQFGSN
ncbi:ribbon-helix-helix domain-containing protein [Natronoarchaeum rubrum]|uniref:ribbon-helix-helix domain-containing protein n=1 Tax=Natronoarchaeum rubrum TaxID=755311 RepID=UPI002110F99E|nr:ribbon-helix-helix domain-containing protein [Natronoarchaeum rubrum]